MNLTALYLCYNKWLPKYFYLIDNVSYNGYKSWVIGLMIQSNKAYISRWPFVATDGTNPEDDHFLIPQGIFELNNNRKEI